MNDGLMVVFIVAAVTIPVTFLPPIIASRRGHKNAAGITILSLLVVILAALDVLRLAAVAYSAKNDPYMTEEQRTRVVVKAIGGLFGFIGFFLWFIALIWSVLAGQDGDRPRYGRRQPELEKEENPFDVAPPVPVPVVPASMPYTCPHCRRIAIVPANMFGFMVTCGGCRGQFTATPPTF
jgi:hypothetical protein